LEARERARSTAATTTLAVAGAGEDNSAGRLRCHALSTIIVDKDRYMDGKNK
jgi:hypothetical protein